MLWSDALEMAAIVLTWLIVSAGVFWLGMFLVIGLKWRRDLARQLAAELEKITQTLPHPVDQALAPQARIAARLLLLHDVLTDPGAVAAREKLTRRLHIHDEDRIEQRRGFRWFAAWWHFFRNTVEAFPAAGILGTVLALAAAYQQGGSLADITAQFGGAVWSTVAGLTFGIVLLAVGSALDTTCEEMVHLQKDYRATISELKRRLPVLEIES